MTNKKNLGKRVKHSYSIKRYNNYSKSFLFFQQIDIKEEVNLRIEYDLLLNKKLILLLAFLSIDLFIKLPVKRYLAMNRYIGVKIVQPTFKRTSSFINNMYFYNLM